MEGLAGNGVRRGVVLAALTAYVWCGQVSAQIVYWIDQASAYGASIHRADADGTDADVLVTTSMAGLDMPASLAIDPQRGKLYWTDLNADKIQRSNLDGSSVEDVLTAADGIDAPYGLAIDPGAARIYWSEAGATPTTLRRATLDGASIEDLATGSGVGLLAIDTDNGLVYWSDAEDLSGAYRANLDGTGVEHIVASASTLLYQGMDVDAQGGKLYWVETGVGQLLRSNVDGSAIAMLRDGVGVEDPRGVALDLPGGTIYWTDFSTQSVRRADLDGSNMQTVLDAADGLVLPVSVAIDYTPRGVPLAVPLRYWWSAFAIALCAAIVLGRNK